MHCHCTCLCGPVPGICDVSPEGMKLTSRKRLNAFSIRAAWSQHATLNYHALMMRCLFFVCMHAHAVVWTHVHKCLEARGQEVNLSSGIIPQELSSCFCLVGFRPERDLPVSASHVSPHWASTFGFFCCCLFICLRQVLSLA